MKRRLTRRPNCEDDKDRLRGLLKRIASKGCRGLPAVGGVRLTGGLLGANDDNTPN